jgi:hypothetical protein
MTTVRIPYDGKMYTLTDEAAGEGGEPVLVDPKGIVYRNRDAVVECNDLYDMGWWGGITAWMIVDHNREHVPAPLAKRFLEPKTLH